MKVLFLDVDGVLNNESSVKHIGPKGIDPTNVRELKRILTETGAKMVLSSSWRYGEELTGTLVFQLRYNGVWDGFVGMTTMNHAPRKDQIREWLDEHPEVETYVILDDFEAAGWGHEGHMVHTTFDTGLTAEDADKAINILNR